MSEDQAPIFTESDSGRKSPMLEITLPGARYHDAAFHFKAPTVDTLAASANRLLRFEFPVRRNLQVYERLIKHCLVATRGGRKVLDDLPVTDMEGLYARLWLKMLNREATPQDAWLTLLILAEETLEFLPSGMVEEDIQSQGQREGATLHSYYFKGELDRNERITVLAEQGARTDLLAAVPADNPWAVDVAYLAARRLSLNLPWLALLQALNEALNPADIPRYPNLMRLQALHRELDRSAPFYQQPLTPENFLSSFEWMCRWLAGETVQAVAVETGVPRPVKELVIVEGETEKLLLPLFAETMGLNFCALGIHIQPAGGKNHVIPLYGQYADILNAPVCMVLDSDAVSEVEELQSLLRPQDCVYQILEGEFEDTYDLKLMLTTINEQYQPYPEVTSEFFADQAADQRRVDALKSIWQSYGLGSFDKVEFAGKLAETIKPPGGAVQNVSPPAATRLLLETILKVRNDALAQTK